MRGLRCKSIFLCVLLYSVAVQVFGTCTPNSHDACRCVENVCNCAEGWQEWVDTDTNTISCSSTDWNTISWKSTSMKPEQSPTTRIIDILSSTSSVKSTSSTSVLPASTTQTTPSTTENIATENITIESTAIESTTIKSTTIESTTIESTTIESTTVATEETTTKEKLYGSNFPLIGGLAFAAALKDGGAFAAAFGKQ